MVDMAVCGVFSQPAPGTIYRDSPSAAGISASGNLNNVQAIGCRSYTRWGSLVLKHSKDYGELRAGNGAAAKAFRVVAQAKNGAGSQAEKKTSTVMQLVPEPLRAFPWQQVLARFGERILELLWTSCGWLLLPVIVVSGLSETSYAMVHNKEFLVPIGLVVGSALAGIVKETGLEYSAHFPDRNVPWHLVVCMLVFVLIKLPGPSYPYWARCILPHIGTGGLWQTWLYLRAWRKEKHGADDAGTVRA